jgi:hypothetical protein
MKTTPQLRPVVLVSTFVWCLFAATPSKAAALNPFQFGALGAMSPTQDVVIDTSTAQMSGGMNSQGVFTNGIAVFCFSEVAIPANVTVWIRGDNPAALLSQDRMVVSGRMLLNASNLVAGPGGGNGGANSTAGEGPGAGWGAGTLSAGGGGAGSISGNTAD